MALVPISDYLTPLPDPRGVNIAAPVSSGILGSIADSVNHDIGWRQLRCGHWIVERKHNYANGGVFTEDPGGKSSQSFPFIFRPDARAEYLQVLVTYQASDNFTTTPRLSVWLETTTGVAVDGSSISPAFLWDYSDGILSASENSMPPVGGLPVSIYPIQHANTGTRVDDTPTRPTKPRCLNGDPSLAGLVNLVVWIREQECRLLTVTIKELYQEMVDQ